MINQKHVKELCEVPSVHFLRFLMKLNNRNPRKRDPMIPEIEEIDKIVTNLQSSYSAALDRERELSNRNADLEALVGRLMKRIEAYETIESVRESDAISAGIKIDAATAERIQELTAPSRVILDQIDGDIRATQFFESRIIQRMKDSTK